MKMKPQFSRKTMTLACLQALGLIAVSTLSAQAETIIYNGDASQLQNPPPMWMNSSGTFLGSQTSISGNTVEVNYTSMVGNNPGTVVGGTSSAGNVTNNTIILNQSNITGIAYGGYSITGNAQGNVVTINAGASVSDARGGYSNAGIASDNVVNLNGGSVGSIYAGYAFNGDSTRIENNTVNITSGSATGNVYGGLNAYAATEISGNAVHMSGGSVTGQLTGGRSYSGSVSGNSVEVSGGTVGGNIYGGFTSATRDKVAFANRVTISGSGTTIGGTVYGGYGVVLATYAHADYATSVIDNVVSIVGSTINAPLYGGYAGMTHNYNDAVVVKAVGNQVELQGATVRNNVFGSYAFTQRNNTNGDTTIYSAGNAVNSTNGNVTGLVYGAYSKATGSVGTVGINATGNAVNWYGGTASGDIYGSYSEDVLSGSADMAVSVSNNVVNIMGGQVDGDVYGGYHQSTNTSTGNSTISITGNTVSVGGAQGAVPVFSANSSLYGGGSSVAAADVFTGNTLHIGALDIAVKNTDQFEYYNFTISSYATEGSVLLSASGTVNLNDATVSLKSIAPGIAVRDGTQVVLINAATLQTNSATTLTNAVPVYQGISLVYDVNVSQLGSDQIVATFSAPDVNDAGTKPLAEGRLAGFAFTLQGADLVAEQGIKSALGAASLYDADVSFFGTMTASSLDYGSGSHFDVDGSSLMGGLAWKHDALVLAGFVEGGWGNYNSYNRFNALSVHGQGDANYYGAGVLGRYTLDNGVYLDGTLRLGQVDTSFKSGDIVSPEGVRASYDSKSAYYSASIGIGHAWKIHDKAMLDVSTQYLWTRQQGDSVTVAGDPIEFEATNSHRWRTMGRVHYDVSPNASVATGLGFEYEFDGKAKANTYHVYDIDAPSIKGGTGIAEFGFSYTPPEMKNLTLDARLRGYAGKREGVAGIVQIRYAF